LPPAGGRAGDRSIVGRGGFVVYNWNGHLDAIDEYSHRVVAALGAAGVEARYLASGLAPLLHADSEADWILLEYNPFRWGHAGFAPGLVRDAVTLRGRSRAMLAIMIHEAWIDMAGAKSTLVGLWQRTQLRTLLRLADRIMTSTEALAEEIGGDAVPLPVASNITPVEVAPAAARNLLGIDDRLVVTLFGRAHPSRALDHAQTAIAALARVHGPARLIVLNLGADAPPVEVPAGVEVRNPGPRAQSEVSLHLSAADLVLLPFVDGVSTRRSTLMAALAHGRAVLGLQGRNTDAVLADAHDALVLTPAGDRAAFARRAVELAADPQRLQRIGAAGHRLYAERFDWPVLARVLADVLGAPRTRPCVPLAAT
jgi:glycosyltransferase involved in cell wall biosynthesis